MFFFPNDLDISSPWSQVLVDITDRVLRAIISALWVIGLVICGATNLNVSDVYFYWINMTPRVIRLNTVFGSVFEAVTFTVITLIIMVSYTKVFLVVRRQVRSTPTDVLGSYGSRTIFGSSVRSAKNLFVMLVAATVLCAMSCCTTMPAVLIKLAWNFNVNYRLQMGPTRTSLFVMCIAYYCTYLPVLLRLMITKVATIPEGVSFTVTWI